MEIYEQRPANCAGYRCGLLQRYQSGDVSLDEALEVINEAKSLAGKVAAEISNVDFPQLRNRWRLGLEAFQDADASAERDQRAYLHLSVLCLFLDRHIAAPGRSANDEEGRLSIAHRRRRFAFRSALGRLAWTR